jgi:tRNA(fMet)-specific endonuclease VapC
MKCPLLLDANAIISLFDGSDPELERALCDAEELIVPVVAYAEVVAGAETDTKRARLTLDALAKLMSTPNTRLLPVSEMTVRYYSKIFNQLKKNGTPIPTNDIWIAAATLEAGGVLFTHDRHFLNIPMFDTIGLEDASS